MLFLIASYLFVKGYYDLLNIKSSDQTYSTMCFTANNKKNKKQKTRTLLKLISILALYLNCTVWN